MGICLSRKLLLAIFMCFLSNPWQKIIKLSKFLWYRHQYTPARSSKASLCDAFVTVCCSAYLENYGTEWGANSTNSSSEGSLTTGNYYPTHVSTDSYSTGGILISARPEYHTTYHDQSDQHMSSCCMDNPRCMDHASGGAPMSDIHEQVDVTNTSDTDTDSYTQPARTGAPQWERYGDHYPDTESHHQETADNDCSENGDDGPNYYHTNYGSLYESTGQPDKTYHDMNAKCNDSTLPWLESDIQVVTPTIYLFSMKQWLNA